MLNKFMQKRKIFSPGVKKPPEGGRKKRMNLFSAYAVKAESDGQIGFSHVSPEGLRPVQARRAASRPAVPRVVVWRAHLRGWLSASTRDQTDGEASLLARHLSLRQVAASPETPPTGYQVHPEAPPPKDQTQLDETQQTSPVEYLCAARVASIRLISRRQIEHDLVAAMRRPLSVRRRIVTMLSRLRQWIEHVEDRVLPVSYRDPRVTGKHTDHP
jgi:hypothetical protein